MDNFLILDDMTSQSGITDPRRAERERLYGHLADFVSSEHPEYVERINGLKHIILQAPLEERLSAYLERLAIRVDDEILRDMLEVRNAIAHARKFDDELLARAERAARIFAREVMRRELTQFGLTFGQTPREEHPGEDE